MLFNYLYIYIFIYLYIYLIYVYIYIYIYIYIYTYILLLLLLWSLFIPSRNLDDVFTYNHIALISLRSHYHSNASTVLTKADRLFQHIFIRSLKYYLKTYVNGPD